MGKAIGIVLLCVGFMARIATADEKSWVEQMERDIQLRKISVEMYVLAIKKAKRVLGKTTLGVNINKFQVRRILASDEHKRARNALWTCQDGKRKEYNRLREKVRREKGYPAGLKQMTSLLKDPAYKNRCKNLEEKVKRLDLKVKRASQKVAQLEKYGSKLVDRYARKIYLKEMEKRLSSINMVIDDATKERIRKLYGVEKSDI